MPEVETDLLRQELHILVDHVRPAEIDDVKEFLRARIDPLELALLAAPLDTEPMSSHERKAWDADVARHNCGEPVLAGDEVLRDLGFSEADLL